MFNNAETSSLWGSNFHGLDLTSNFVSSPAPSSLENMPYSAFGTSPTNSAFRLPKNSTHTATTIAAGVNEAEEVACLTRAKDTFFQDLKRMKTCVSDLSMEFVNSSNEESMTRDRMDQTLMFVDLIMTDLQNLRGLVVKKLDNQKPIPQVLHHSASEDHEQKAPQDKDKLIVSTTEEVVNTTITRNNLKSDTRLSDNSEANVKINRNNNQLLSEAISQLDDLSLIEENNSPIQNKKSVSPTSESSCAKEGDDEMDIPPIIDAKGVKIIPRNKLHVSRLPGNVSRDFAVEIFSKYGNLESLHFPSYKKRTFLFARYKTIKDAIKVYKSPPVFPGEEAPVRIQFYDENYKNPHGDVNTHLKLVLENNVKKLFVKGIPQACHWQELKDYFRKNFGEVINVDVYPSHNPYVSHMGCGEVEMLHLEDARKVVAQAKHVLQGEIIRIEPHRSRSNKIEIELISIIWLIQMREEDH